MKLKDFSMERFLEQRKEIFKLIDREIELDGYYKSYEGRFEIVFNNRFHYDEDDPEIYFNLSCYLAPINGRGTTFETQEEIDELITLWKVEIEEE